jgi:hypothetical protein
MNVQELLAKALDVFHAAELHLLRTDASERSMTHRLALHLTPLFPEFDVDCEYNRDGFDVKRLALHERPVQDDDTEAVTVFPDIVVHRRGHNDANLLVIEVKKAISAVNADYDMLKLNAFKSELKYRHAVHLTLWLDADGTPATQVIWLDD